LATWGNGVSSANREGRAWEGRKPINARGLRRRAIVLSEFRTLAYCHPRVLLAATCLVTVSEALRPATIPARSRPHPQRAATRFSQAARNIGVARTNRKMTMRTLFGIFFLLLSTHASADGWTTDFTVTNLYVSGQNNFQYRVYGMPAVSSCTNGPTWAYINDSDPGSQGFYAAILSAYDLGKVIRLNIQTVNGFCHIVELFVSG
jgi:hypothetical protein